MKAQQAKSKRIDYFSQLGLSMASGEVALRNELIRACVEGLQVPLEIVEIEIKATEQKLEEIETDIQNAKTDYEARAYLEGE